MDTNSILTNLTPIQQVAWNSGGAAMGGFIGVIVFFLVRLIFEYVGKRPKAIQTYQCASNINQGQEKEVEGELKHHHGRRVEGKTLGGGTYVWEWTRDRTGDKNGDSVFYGPYVTDFTEPGLYAVVFRILGKGFTKPEEIINDVNILELDVNCILPELIAVQQGIANIGKNITAARRFIRVSQLATGGWQEFELRIWSNGGGIWEYRAFAFDGRGKQPDNIRPLGENVKIYFDNVVVKKLGRMTLPVV